MATFNRSNVLPYSIASVLAQTRTNFELLVIGDGCTDNSQSVVEAIGDHRIRWIGLQNNSGHQSSPNNAGLAEAKGEYVAYLGHDDLWLPHHLDICLAAIESGSDFAYGLSLIAAEDRRRNYLGPIQIPYAFGNWIPPSSVVHKKSVTDCVGNWQQYSELDVGSDPDTELWQRISQAGYQMSLIPRLSVVKIPAAERKDVYQTRSTEEQDYWWARIKSEAGFEAKELAICYVYLRSLDAGQIGTTKYGLVVRHFLYETVFRIRNRLHRPIGSRVSIVEKSRRHKGLSAKP